MHARIACGIDGFCLLCRVSALSNGLLHRSGGAGGWLETAVLNRARSGFSRGKNALPRFSVGRKGGGCGVRI